MELGMIGLGRMGSNMVRRLQRRAHRCVVYDKSASAAAAVVAEGAAAASSLKDLAAMLSPPRAIWMMVPAPVVEETIAAVSAHLQAGDILIDGGNSNYRDSMRRADELRAAGLHYVDVGTSGGIWGLDNGYCLMAGGEAQAIARLEPVFRTLAPGTDAAPALEPGPFPGTAALGYLHCGANGAGHFVKMVHNGIEYGMMAAYAEGMNLLRQAGAPAAAETPGALRSELDVAAIAELWRRGSVVRSWLLDLLAHSLRQDPALAAFHGRVDDSGEGRWTVTAGIDLGVPLPVLSLALFSRFSSRGNAAYGDKVLSALRSEFGGHREPAAPGSTS